MWFVIHGRGLPGVFIADVTCSVSMATWVPLMAEGERNELVGDTEESVLLAAPTSTDRGFLGEDMIQ